jgi:hypothetical protein
MADAIQPVIDKRQRIAKHNKLPKRMLHCVGKPD